MRQFLNVDNEDENCQTSQIYYMELADEHPDSDETMLEVAEVLLDKFTTETQQGWVVLVGDGKTYEHLMNIKRHYGQALQKLLIFPGDWHTLKNFQPVLMKIYYSAGLKELAMTSGYHGPTLSSLENWSNFKRTHCFLLQVWEALHREMFQSYTKHSQSTASAMLDTTKCILCTAIQENLEPEELMKRVERLMQNTDLQADFLKFLECQSQADDTWKFWSQFILSDCYAYIGLYFRGGNWRLRMSSLKQMAPLFAAFDRDSYQRIIPNHLAHLEEYPKEILQCLEAGEFTVNLTGRHWHSIAFDEAHEMCINKDLKTAIIRPTKSYQIFSSSTE